MTVKRALIALVALSLTPALAMAQPFHPITPADGTANVVVQKVFLDGTEGPLNGNDETPVTVTLQCTSGTYAPATVEVSPDVDNPFLIEHIFVISDIPLGPDNVCTVTEAPVPGYEALYACRPVDFPDNGDPNEFCDPQADVDEDDYLSLDMCQFDDVEEGDVARCIIFNRAEPVDVEVTKVWDIVSQTRNDVEVDVRIELYCNAEIVGGTPYGGDDWYAFEWLNLDDGDFDDEDDEYTGMGTVTFEVIPEFYSTADDPDDQEYTTCYATENVQDSAVEVDNDCGDIEVAVGMGDECTITNTVFFEGIPTLNQYGMAIMALLMLGVGFVGFRRFV